jgi:hypothetical protein
MEGFASYMADDEQSWDKMYLRDAVVNDAIPPISRADFPGFLAYRFGHAVFDFMEERWGEDGIQDFIYELRNTINSRPDRAIERAFRIEPEDFDADFRRWLCRSWSRAGSRSTSGGRSASSAGRTRSSPRRWPRRRAIWWPPSAPSRARSTWCSSTPASAGSCAT